MAIAIASNALTTVAALQAELLPGEFRSSDRETLIINAASDLIEAECGRKFQKKTITAEKHQGRGHLFLRLDRYPIMSVSAVRVNGTALKLTDFDILADSGMLWKSDSWPWNPGAFQDLTRDPDPGSSDYNIEVDYIGGYVLPNDTGTISLPYALQLACIQLCLWMRSVPGLSGLESERIGNYSWKASQEVASRGIPANVLALIAPYRQAVIA